MNRPRALSVVAIAAFALFASLSSPAEARRSPFALPLEESAPTDPSRVLSRTAPSPFTAPASLPAKTPLPRGDGFSFTARILDVASAGDVDGNGMTDWIRGESGFSPPGLTAAGRAVVERRLPNGGSTQLELFGATAFENFGASVACAGDINGDGYDEIVVGAPRYAGQRGRAYVFRGTASGITVNAPWVIEGVGPQDHLGFSVAGAGDVNGDGFDDVLVGSPGADTGPQFTDGRVSCYLGGSNGLDLVPAWTVDGMATNDWLGWSVAGNGDVNADGYADVAVTSPNYFNGQITEGRVQIHLGGPSGLATGAAFNWESNAANSGQDLQVALPGDVDGDGYGDLVIGIPGADFGGSVDGGAIRVFGGSPFVFFMSELGSHLQTVDNMHYGEDVAPGGDINGDGFADFLVGAPDYASGGAWVEFLGTGNFDGQTFIPHLGSLDVREGYAVAGGGDRGDGRSTILVGGLVTPVAPNPGPESSPPTGEIQGGGLIVTEYAGITLPELGYLPDRAFAQGDVLDNRFGNALALADVNGDGYSDVIVGSNAYDSSRGRVAAYYGEPQGFSIPPFARAPKPKDPALAGGGGSVSFQIPDWTFTGIQPDANVGVSVANAGDVNGDGYEDVLAGAVTYLGGEGLEGAAYVFFGGPDGLSLSPDWMTEGNEAPAYYGYSVATAGDVNQDGYDDILVGAPLASPNAVPQAGKVYLYYGSATGPAHMPARVFAGGDEAAFLGAAIAGIGDVDGDGHPEIAMSESGWTNGQTNEGRVRVFRGGPGGVETNPILTWETDFAETGLFRLAPAGDVDGDGYADLLVGGNNYTNGEIYEGAVFLFLGSPQGLGVAPFQTLEPDLANDHFGSSVWSAGDLDGDGYGDVIVGSPQDFNEIMPGRVQVFFGSENGLETTSGIDYGATFTGELGAAVSGGGDVNGDGQPDIVFSAPMASPSKLSNTGVVYVGLDNVIEDGLARPVRTLRTDNLTPIPLALRSDSPTSFRVQGLARTPAGRGRVRLQWQAKTPAQALDLRNIGTSNALRTGIPAFPTGSTVTLGGVVSGGFGSGDRLRFRARYTTRHPYFQRTRWFTAHRNGAQEIDLRMQGPTGFTGVPEPTDGVPAALSFAGAVPNPLIAGEGTTLRFALPAAGRVTIEAWDAAGRKVARVLDDERAAGRQAVTWNGRDDAGRALPRGLYFLKLSTSSGAVTAKAVIAR